MKLIIIFLITALQIVGCGGQANRFADVEDAHSFFPLHEDRGTPPFRVDEVIRQVTPIVATHYTLRTWAPDFWGYFNPENIKNDLQEIRKYGFNTLILNLPWAGFQTETVPIAYYEPYFVYLKKIIKEAEAQSLSIVFRIGYEHSNAPPSTPTGVERKYLILNDADTQKAWFDYLQRLDRIADESANFLFGFIAWEDFFILEACHPDDDERVMLARKFGFQSYLKRYPLQDLSKAYGKQYSAYDLIPIPACASSASKYFYEFWDDFLLALHRKSQRIFQRLSMEVRVDCDPMSGGEYFCHEKTLDLDGWSDLTVVYFSPAWGAENRGGEESASSVLDRLSSMLSWVSEHSGNHIFVDQFNFVDNTPGFENNSRILPDEVGRFVASVEPILRRETLGYGLWSARDVPANIIKDGGFEREGINWELESARVRRDDNGHVAVLAPGGKAISRITDEYFYTSRVVNGQAPVFTLLIKARSPRPTILRILVRSEDGDLKLEKKIDLSAKEFDRLAFTGVDVFRTGWLEIHNIGSVEAEIDEVRMFSVVQENGIVDMAGSNKSFYPDVIRLNNQLQSRLVVADAEQSPNHDGIQWDNLASDKWVGESIDGLARIMESTQAVNFDIYVPVSWKKYSNTINFYANDIFVGKKIIRTGFNRISFEINGADYAGGSPFPTRIKIRAEQVYSPGAFGGESADTRLLSFQMINAALVD